MSRICLLLGMCFALCNLLAAEPATLAAGGGKVCVLSIDGAIGPATTTYIRRGIREAEAQGAQCLIIQLDTPGGLLESTKQIIQAMLASPVPTVVYVAPSGATATSAGCFLTMAADVAAMAPATSIGAAHPVQLSSSGGGSTQPEDVMKTKLENYAASYIESIATQKHRNAEWAASAVRQSASISADKALELKVVEILARDLPDLLGQLDGRKVGEHTLEVAHTRVIELPMSLRERALQLLGHPELMFILMLIAIYGIIGELSSPGAILPGVAGAIAIILMLFMSATLPVNLAGLALVLLAIALFIFDAFAPTHGVLTTGGIVAFFLGALMLFDRSEPMLRISLWLIIPATAVTAAFFLYVASAGLRAQMLPHRTGMESMLGTTAVTVTEVNASGGKVTVQGEYWNAISATPIAASRQVRIVSAAGLQLKVEPTEKES